MMLAERHGSPNSHQMDAHHELHHHASAATTGSNVDDNLHTFREALAFSSESLFVGNICLFDVILTVHRQYVEIRCQLDATEVFVADLIACSTC